MQVKYRGVSFTVFNGRDHVHIACTETVWEMFKLTFAGVKTHDFSTAK